MNITAAFTSFNRTELLYDAVKPFLGDDRVSEIVISDDCSQIDLYNTIVSQYASHSKVKVFRNDVNLDCYHNKAKAIERSTNEWVLILDSDNIFSTGFIDRLENLCQAGLNEKHVYQPEFARPHFNFTHLSGELITRNNVAYFMDKGNTGTMLNAMNYMVNRDQYLKVFDPNTTPVTSDSIYQNYRWLESGRSIYVVSGLQYDHRVHNQSHYQNNVKRTPQGFHESIENKLKAMR